MATMEEIVSLCKRRGFVFPGSEIYGGLANSWDYGPLGVELKNNIKQLWWKIFVHGRDDIVGIDAAIIMNPRVWEASGHVAGFVDPLVECKSCHNRYRVDHLLTLTPEELTKLGQEVLEKLENVACQNCGKKSWAEPKQFNLLFRTFIGPVDDGSNVAYLRGETAQAMFVDFKQVLETTAKSIPFGIAQIGRAFRNEITPGNFIFRTREFELMEIEYFIPEPAKDEEWQKYFEEWREAMHRWFKLLGLEEKNIYEAEIPDGERAHYSKRTIDFEYDFPFGRKELYGLAYRTNYDLLSHQKVSGRSLAYRDPETGREYVPHVIEPTWGVDRSVLAVICAAYTVESEGEKKRIYLKLPPKLAPVKVAVFPLLRNKPDLVVKAKSVYQLLKTQFVTVWDDRGNIGKRYFAQDEVGTPWSVTVDFQTLEDETVTVRDRDTTKQERIKIADLIQYINKRLI